MAEEASTPTSTASAIGLDEEPSVIFSMDKSYVPLRNVLHVRPKPKADEITGEDSLNTFVVTFVNGSTIDVESAGDICCILRSADLGELCSC